MTEPNASEYTRHYIVQALFKLMALQEFGTITVTDIARKAGVGRATFYRYFNSKEDVIRDYFKRKTWEFQSEQRYRPRCREDYRELVMRIFRMLEQNKEPFRLLQRAHLQYLYLDYLNDSFRTMFSDDCLDDNPLKPYAYSGSLFNISMKWVEADCREPMEQAVEALLDASIGVAIP